MKSLDNIGVSLAKSKYRTLTLNMTRPYDLCIFNIWVTGVNHVTVCLIQRFGFITEANASSRRCEGGNITLPQATHSITRLK